MTDKYTVRRIEAIARGMLLSPNLEPYQREIFLTDIISCCDILEREDE